ncbi:DUF6326 family protein [Maribacter aurantiacus]|uniref:Uncharacterized protein n=1 Tax=Maribacter aurantiacus TaxID=1882343 RepID=A0A5R8M6S8_9FLAO|nr:DUF6326 family protein [Maribacter aurantiacus]TLF45288.1 hypothetical protein FEK29_07845 [Maribacter aurantiacus]
MKLSKLWIVVILNIIFADILSIIIELENGNTLHIIGEDVKITMAFAALVINIPISMIYFSSMLSSNLNRMLNLISAVLTIAFVIGGGSWMPHYIVCSTIEVIVLLIIIWTTIKR